MLFSLCTRANLVVKFLWVLKRKIQRISLYFENAYTVNDWLSKIGRLSKIGHDFKLKPSNINFNKKITTKHFFFNWKKIKKIQIHFASQILPLFDELPLMVFQIIMISYEYHKVESRSTSWLLTPHVTNWI